MELKACLKEYQFTIVNDCELQLHLTLVLSTALNKEHTMTIYVNLQKSITLQGLRKVTDGYYLGQRQLWVVAILNYIPLL